MPYVLPGLLARCSVLRAARWTPGRRVVHGAKKEKIHTIPKFSVPHIMSGGRIIQAL